jgi:aminopeptidase YwaD
MFNLNVTETDPFSPWRYFVEEGIMTAPLLAEKAAAYLRQLCVDIPSRRVGSRGNQQATAFFASVVASFGWATEAPEFDCIDWSTDEVRLTAEGTPFEAFASPYSLGCEVRAPLLVASTVEELAAADASDAILLLRGTIAREQLMPKRFPFYNPDSHKQIIKLLETRRPRAIIAATSRDMEMVGAGCSPFPLIEDGDFDIPSVYMTDEAGRRLAGYAGKQVALTSRARRIPAKGCNIIARKGAQRQRRVVLFAHIDTHIGTPGANDNASGVTALLLLAELLVQYAGQLWIELVALNGEDYFSNPGEQQYLALNAGRFDEIVLGINLDGLAYYKGRSAYSLYDCPPAIAGSIRQVFARCRDLVEGEPWYQGDHGLFLLKGRPALAITSELVAELMTKIIHTPDDTPEMVDPARLATVALALRDLLLGLDRVAE